MEAEKTFDAEKVGEQIRRCIEAAERVLDEVTADAAKAREALIKLGFVAQTQEQEDAHFSAMSKKLAQVTAQVAFLHGLLAFEKAMVDVPVSLNVLSASYSALLDAMNQTSVGRIPGEMPRAQ